MLENVATISPMFQNLLNKMAKDMRFVGIFYIIVGGFTCLSIIGAIIGVPYIICGIRLRESANFFDNYSYGGDTGILENAIDKQSRFFFIQKVIMIITIVMLVLYIIFIFAFIGKFMSSFGGGSFPST